MRPPDNARPNLGCQLSIAHSSLPCISDTPACTGYGPLLLCYVRTCASAAFIVADPMSILLKVPSARLNWWSTAGGSPIKLVSYLSTRWQFQPNVSSCNVLRDMSPPFSFRKAYLNRAFFLALWCSKSYCGKAFECVLTSGEEAYLWTASCS